MNPYAPIQGISLERYADLGAELDGIEGEAEKEAKIASLGVPLDDWRAAVEGWTARMQDMSLMGQVATRYMQHYNAALAAKKGVAHVSFEDFCAISASVQVFGFEGSMRHFGLSQGEWTTISSHWMGELSRDPMNLAVRRNQLQEQEALRLRSGGQPGKVSVERRAAGTPAPSGGVGLDPNAAMAMQMQAAMAHNQQHAYGGAAAAAAAMQQQGALGMMGGLGMMSGFGAPPPTGGIEPGKQVLVAWSDGNKYPATVTQVNGAQANLVFPNGQTMWVELRHLTPA
ncbi:MAG: hypothetical protein FJ095_15825 [Deltaproteobacteria bacterium]|nr:hypothetical protein [Deltaproteobacteria bacterium]